MAKDEERDFNEPIKGHFPSMKDIICKDCAFRDKTVVEIDGKKRPVGVTKSFCAVFQPPPKSNGKPSEVLFQNGDCKYYFKDS